MTSEEHLNRLATLIDESGDEILKRWKALASEMPRASRLEEPWLLDHMPSLLRELSKALFEARTKSVLEMTAHRSPEAHGASRFRLGFDVEEVVAEFNLLREVLQQFAEENGVAIIGDVNYTINRIIDKDIALSIKTYVRQASDEIERRRRERLSFVIHDLKTPISAIATATYVIENNLSGETRRSVVAPMLDLLRRNAGRLNDMVMKIINNEAPLHAVTGRSPELQIDFREIDLWPVAERLKQDCLTIAESQNNVVRNETPHDLRVWADPDLLVTVFQNLLSNALKYTHDGEIVMDGAQQDDMVVCWIRDTGAGIPPERLGHIFEQRASDPQMAGSTGLGLSIVQQIVALHGGSISVDSEPGKGSIFTLKFPNRSPEG